LIRFSKRTDYGLIAIRHLGHLPDGARPSAREIASVCRIPAALMAKLLQRMARRGLVASQQGTKGGYRIARPPTEITLRDVIEAIEGPLAVVDCLDGGRKKCALLCGCTLRRPLQRVQDRIVEVLGQTTVGDL
jgi:Rrf2 family protein